MKKIMALTGGALALFLLSAPALNAERGVGVTLGEITVNGSVKPGGQYHLPQIGVLNTGSTAEDYRLSLSFLTNRSELRPDESWLRFDPPIVRIEPGASQMVNVRLEVPTGARAGDYFALLEASVGDQSTDTMLAGAATKLTFTVAPSSWLDAQRTRLNRWLDDAQPWTTIVPIALLVAIAFRWSSRRVRFRLPFEPR
ncbi:MAG: hypothetical protein AB7T32_10880 [Dehalococcoidia bacterium]